jgi:hypothetical protein
MLRSNQSHCLPPLLLYVATSLHAMLAARSSVCQHTLTTVTDAHSAAMLVNQPNSAPPDMLHHQLSTHHRAIPWIQDGLPPQLL